MIDKIVELLDSSGMSYEDKMHTLRRAKAIVQANALREFKGDK